MKYLVTQYDRTFGESQNFICCEKCLKELEPINQEKYVIDNCDQELCCEFCNK
jgi:hydrogenase maturation factor HypF (carbamoyltransferase family)